MAVKTSLRPFWAKGPCVSASLLFLLDTCHPDLSREYLPPPDCGPSQSGQNAVTELTMKGKKKSMPSLLQLTQSDRTMLPLQLVIAG